LDERDLELVLQQMVELLTETDGGFIELLDDSDFPHLKSVKTFDEAGLLTRDRGLVIRLGDPLTNTLSEFQLVIKRSR
jgi:hypothetical protein